MDNEEPITLGRAIDIIYDPLESITRENFDARDYLRTIVNDY